uniref:PsbP C-terminal domain-containing protein n=1 Tax=Eucampia antarctica TaxID=49252 RepID=A0A7S2RMC0_9STRA|mmetsp:Transcript_24168/g.23216  ORF Transcript_24168/g.23216 Transcript_24168/m.23216 type:complete len:225 (+) Transcript_24168:80-754(+)|eukprot:CAMPEP_0197828326 /NCGR_PEP_ID=MMETSP1437-20131217/4908_1 /TAXON_ID=49252 ORGANISM="Eucampia antarctica, Strain CCMP1452" /NCGR_SAMPLE_ID=MMETSP1437 /ASSEMBLY_ACC=CAM_ASM_001096 /LENGTH=224 /DNA_ID=CAMNT_0043429497 /DNA_START=78 /DNA_END=752 /DNA_ORIENTATION=+
MTKTSLILLALIAPMGANAFAGMNSGSASPDISRRESITKTIGVFAGTAGIVASLPSMAFAAPEEEVARITTRMGGNLERYGDTTRGLSLMVPSGWNKFEGEVGAYDLKWEDLVEKTENIKISSTPVKSTTTSINALGDDVQVLGASLAAKRNAKLVKASERLTDGVLYYIFDFAISDGTHQLLSLCVAKGKLFSLDANSRESRWPKRKEIFNNVVGSFAPTLN